MFDSDAWHIPNGVPSVCSSIVTFSSQKDVKDSYGDQYGGSKDRSVHLFDTYRGPSLPV